MASPAMERKGMKSSQNILSDLGVFYQDIARSITWRSWKLGYSELRLTCVERSRAKA